MTASPDVPEPVKSTQKIVLAAMIVSVATFLLYSGVLKNDFLGWDDQAYVTKNPHLQPLNLQNVVWIFSHSYFLSWTPLTLLSHSLDFLVWQLDPRGHHLTSLLLHSFNAMWFFWLCLTILFLVKNRREDSGSEGGLVSFRGVGTGAIIASAFAAVLYACHPLRVESVACISDRKDLLCAFFVFVSVIAYLRSASPDVRAVRWFWYWAAFVLFVLGLLSKATAVVLPGIFLLLDVYLLYPRSWRKETATLMKQKLPFFAVSMCVGVIAVVTSRMVQDLGTLMVFSTAERLLLPLYNISFYLEKSIWPVNLAAMYHDGIGIMGLLAVSSVFITVIAVALAAHRRWHWLCAWLCYIVALVPTMGVLSSTIQPTADRYAYLPLVSLFILVGGGIERVMARYISWGTNPTKRLATWALAIGLLVVLGDVSLRQIERWRDTETLWRHVIEVSPDVSSAYYNLGLSFHERGDFARAKELYEKAIELQAGYPDVYINLGNIYAAGGASAKGIALYRQAIQVAPAYTLGYTNLGNTLTTVDSIEAAISAFREALRVEPNSADAAYGLGYAFYRKGDLRNSMEMFQKVVTISPRRADAFMSLGILYRDMGDFDASREAFRQAARLGSRDAQKYLAGQGINW